MRPVAFVPLIGPIVKPAWLCCCAGTADRSCRSRVPLRITFRRLLRNYFDGDIGCLGTIEWRTAGTSFQQSVWGALTTIAPGETLSYGALAMRLGYPKSVRAIGRRQLSTEAESDAELS